MANLANTDLLALLVQMAALFITLLLLAGSEMHVRGQGAHLPMESFAVLVLLALPLDVLLFTLLKSKLSASLVLVV